MQKRWMVADITVARQTVVEAVSLVLAISHDGRASHAANQLSLAFLKRLFENIVGLYLMMWAENRCRYYDSNDAAHEICRPQGRGALAGSGTDFPYDVVASIRY